MNELFLLKLTGIGIFIFTIALLFGCSTHEQDTWKPYPVKYAGALHLEVKKVKKRPASRAKKTPQNEVSK
jgi:hypothetical protein